MIKCNKSEVLIDGNKVVILAECSTILERVYRSIAEMEGEKRAREYMETVWDAAFLSEEELEAKNKAMEEELPPMLRELANSLVDMFSSMSGGGAKIALAM